MTIDQHAPPTGGRTPTVIRVLVLATFVVILNETIMINAIPRLMSDLEVTESAAQWVSTAFMLTMAAVIPTTGWFLQRVPTRTATPPPWVSSSRAPCSRRWPRPSRSCWPDASSRRAAPRS
ncbi:MFS transporter [Nocardia thailandica]|uniref:MFS transporter n=1 Tax=Nocardia thailandica TaxID=257275 RepID=A0ABW6PRZ9_9NOCA